ncbi:PTS transporter subunit EIIC, partial [Staphylococcus aureus]|uniref:PTS transporter subunit EIIC n=1 Tax=Staphylococcus aureus TaxID=1280 RepID=UPI00351F7131
MKSLFEKAQQFGKSFMLPIAILPAAGLLLGIGGALSNPNTVKAYPILDITLLQTIFTLMSAAGSIVFQNLPVIFAIGALVASLLWGYVSDLLKGRRALVAIGCTFMITFVVLFYTNATSVLMVN